MLLSLRTLALAFWFGGGLATVFATRAIFAVAENRRQAGDFSGAVLRAAQWGRFGWAVPFLVSAFGPRGFSFWLGCVALAFAVVQLGVDLQVRRIRPQIETDEAARRRFGALHGVSVLLLFAHLVGAGIALVRL